MPDDFGTESHDLGTEFFISSTEFSMEIPFDGRNFDGFGLRRKLGTEVSSQGTISVPKFRCFGTEISSPENFATELSIGGGIVLSSP